MNCLYNILYGSCLFIIISTRTGEGALPCALREVSKGKLVCVCNATYCDALDADAASVAAGRFKLFSSSKAGLRFQASEGALGEASAATNDALMFVADPNTTYQTIIGWGTAFTDSAGMNILNLSAPAQNKLLESYFSEKGLKFNMGRVPMAGTDFSTHRYTYDDVTGDENLSSFKLTFEDHTYKIPIIKRAQAMSNDSMKLLSAAWTAPPWMKTNNDYNGWAYLQKKYYQTWADYFIKFFHEYKKYSIDFWAVSTGNEPTNSIVVSFNSMQWTTTAQRTWIAQNLGPTLQGSDFNYVKILIMDDQRLSLPWWATRVLRDPVTKNYTAGIAVHWYTDKFIPPSVLTATHEIFPDKFILATEASEGFSPLQFTKVDLGSWKRGESYMSAIMEDLKHWVVGWVDWNMALNLQGGPNWANNFVDAAVIVNATADEFYKQPMLYAMGHFSRFVPAGSVRISVQPDKQNSVSAIAFVTPSGQTVLVIYNEGSSERQITVRHPDKGKVATVIASYSFNTLLF